MLDIPSHVPERGEKGESGVLEFWLLQSEGPFLGVCCPF